MQIKGREPDQCDTYRWCEETGPHSQHVRYLASYAAMERATGRCSLVVLETGITNEDRHVELAFTAQGLSASIMLTREQEKELAQTLGRKPAR